MSQELLERVQKRLKTRTASPYRYLLSHLHAVEAKALRHPYCHFWYYLGEELKPRTIAAVGSQNGSVEAACCILGAKAEKVCLFESVGLSAVNIKSAGATLGAKNWDLAIVDGSFDLEQIWGGLNLGGHLCVIDADINDFAKIHNRTACIDLKHKIGLMRK